MAKHSFPYKPICFRCKAACARAERWLERKDEVNKRVGEGRTGGGREGGRRKRRTGTSGN